MMNKEKQRTITSNKEMEDRIALLKRVKYTHEEAIKIVTTPGMFEKIADELYYKLVSHPHRALREQEAKWVVEGVYISY